MLYLLNGGFENTSQLLNKKKRTDNQSALYYYVSS